MGRLQKKKKPGSKKKKKAADQSSSSSSRQTSGSSAPAGILARESKKRSAANRRGPVASAGTGTGKIRKNYLDVVTQFLREVVMELKKVTWPSRQQTTGSTVVMIILVAIISMFLGMVDIGLSKLVQAVLQ